MTLTRAQMRKRSQAVANVYMNIEDEMLINIGKALKKHRGALVDDPHTWQLLQLRELGALNQAQLITVAKHSGLAIDEVIGVLNGVGYEVAGEVASDVTEAVRQGASMTTLLPATGVVDRVVNQMITQSKTSLNMVNTTMLNQAQQVYRGILQDTVAKVLVGTMTPQQALRSTINKWADQGIPALVDASGRHWQPEAYINMIMRTTSNSVANGVQDQAMDHYGIDLVEISSHMGARPLCAPYQGRIYDRNGKSSKYPSLSTTSYGEPAGIRGVNCGHLFYPFIEGVSIQRNFPVDSETNDQAYKESQYQRKLENDIRKAKRRETVLTEAGDTEGAKEQNGRVKAKQKEMRDFIEQTGRTRRRGREQVYAGAPTTPTRTRPKTPTPKPTMPGTPPPPPVRLISEGERAFNDLLAASEDGMDLYANAIDNPLAMAHLKDLLKQRDGKTGAKLDSIFKDMNGGTNIQGPPVSTRAINDFKPGEPKHKPSDLNIFGRTDGRTNMASAPTGTDIMVNIEELATHDAITRKGIISHEVGHVISNSHDGLAEHILENPQGALGVISEGRFKGVGGTFSPEESWADSYSAYMTDKAWLKDKHPKAFEFVEATLDKIPSHSVYLENALAQTERLVRPQKVKAAFTHAMDGVDVRNVINATDNDMLKMQMRNNASKLLGNSGMGGVPLQVDDLLAMKRNYLGVVKNIYEPHVDGWTEKVIKMELDSSDYTTSVMKAKTTFHEFYHAKSNGMMANHLASGSTEQRRAAFKEYIEIEEFMTEMSAHKMMKMAGVEEELPFAYSKYIVRIAPRLKAHPDFKDATTFDEIQDIAMGYRFNNELMKNDWSDIKKAIDGEGFSLMRYAKLNYKDYAIENRTNIIDTLMKLETRSSRAAVTRSFDRGWGELENISGNAFEDSLAIIMARIGVK